MQQLVAGERYMNTLAYFAELEADPLRADCKEGDALWLQPDRVTFSIAPEGGIFLPIEGLTGPIRYSHPDDRRINVYCLYAVTDHTELPASILELLLSAIRSLHFWIQMLSYRESPTLPRRSDNELSTVKYVT